MTKCTRTATIALVVVSMLAMGNPLVTAEPPELSARAAELLQKLPGDSAAIRAEVLRLDPQDIKTLCARLVEPGTADDNKARLALHGLAMAIADAGQDTAQDTFVKTLADVLSTDPRPHDSPFLVEELRWAGGARALDALGALLRDDALCDAAARALLTIGSDAVAPVFRTALPNAHGPCRLTIIDALAALHDTQSIPLLLKDAGSDDPALRLAALHALACTGQPALTDTLLKAAQTESPYERARAVDFLLIFSRRLSQTKHADQAAALLRDLYRQHANPDEIHVRCAALSALGETLGPTALADVLPALAEENPQLRAAAVNVAAALPGKDVTQKLIGALDNAAPTARVTMLDALARRRDPAALLPIVHLLALSDAPPEVRIAAINAAATLGAEKIVNPVMLALAAPQAEVRKAAQDALVRIPGTAATTEIIANFKPSLPPEVRATLLDILAARPPTGDVAVVLENARDPVDQVRLAALRALELLAADQDVPALLSLLTRAVSDEERAAATKAVAAVVRRAADREAAAALVVAAADGQSVAARSALLSALGRIGGPRALTALQAALAGEESEIREAAARAFGEWPDASPAPQLLEFAQKTPVEKQNVLAVRAYIRMVSLTKDRPAAETRQMCAAALEAARRPDERKLVLTRLGDVKDAESITLLETFLTDEALGSEAAAAILGIVESNALGPCGEPRPTLEKIIARDFPNAIRERAQKALERLEDCKSFITDWWVAGPYTHAGKAGNELFDVVFPPEEPGATDIEWRKQPVHPSPDRAWSTDLSLTMRGDNRAGYLFTRVYSPKEQPARLELGSDDGIKAWLNGHPVHANNALRGMNPGDDKINVTLKDGWNTLLLKVTNNGGGWNACARLRAPDGGTLADVRAEAGEKP